MDASRHGTAGIVPTAGKKPTSAPGESARQRLIALVGMLGALAASSCCIVPLVLFSLGVGGAWIGNLTALAPYKPLFIAATTGVLGYGFYLVYWKPRRACVSGATCASVVASRLVRIALWIATLLVAAAFAFDYVAPLLLPA
ncbi:MAG: mercury transporter MerT [Gemmatimonadales bacterium]|nr:mercury transporter MerT [Gemmatimonadales bacterium]